MRIHFEDVDLPVFVNFISKLTGRNFVFSEKIAGTVTIISPEPVTVDQAYAVFQSVLNTRGLTTIDDGVVARVVPLKEARSSGGPVIGRDPGATGYATRLIPLEYVSVDEAAEALQTLVSRDGSLTPYQATNTLIASDTIVNLARIAAVVQAIDTPRHEQAVEVVPLEHAESRTLAEQITTILQHDTVARPAGAKEKGGARVAARRGSERAHRTRCAHELAHRHGHTDRRSSERVSSPRGSTARFAPATRVFTYTARATPTPPSSPTSSARWSARASSVSA